MIDKTQKEEFKRRGYLVLDDVIDESVINEARSLVWDALSITPESPPKEMRKEEYDVLTVNDVADSDPFNEIRDTMFEYAEALVGQDTLDKTTRPTPSEDIPNRLQVINNYPQAIRLPNTHLRNMGYGPRGNETTASGHIDGYGMNFKEPGSSGEYLYSTIGATVYLNRIKTGGGGFTVFPGSHWIAEKYFEEHSLESLGFKGQLPAIDDNGGWNYEESLFQQLRPKEITGESGLLLLRHMKLLHGASVNQRTRPRMATVCRFARQEGDAIKREAASNIWKYWDNIKDIDIDLSTNPIEY